MIWLGTDGEWLGLVMKAKEAILRLNSDSGMNLDADHVESSVLMRLSDRRRERRKLPSGSLVGKASGTGRHNIVSLCPAFSRHRKVASPDSIFEFRLAVRLPFRAGRGKA